MADKRSNIKVKMPKEDAENLRRLFDEDKSMDRSSRTVRKSVVGQFGIISGEGKEISVLWVSSERRRLVEPDPELQKPTPVSHYGQSLLDSCFKNW